jgi:hypothetical protein
MQPQRTFHPPPTPHAATRSVLPVCDCRCAHRGDGDGRGAGGACIAHPRPRQTRRREGDDDDMTEFEKSPDDNQPPRGGRGRQPRCWARRESGVSRGTGGGITFGRSPNDNQPRLGESAAAPGEGESATTPGVGGSAGAPGEEARRRWSRRSSCPFRRSCKVARRRGTSSNDVVVTSSLVN